MTIIYTIYRCYVHDLGNNLAASTFITSLVCVTENLFNQSPFLLTNTNTTNLSSDVGPSAISNPNMSLSGVYTKMTKKKKRLMQTLGPVVRKPINLIQD